MLMKRLGYTRYVAQGGDWGNAISEVMALQQPPGLLAIHTNMSATLPEAIRKALPAGPPPAGLSPDEQHAWDQLTDFYVARPRLCDRDEPAAADALRARGFAGRPRRVDPRPRHPELST